MPLSWRHFVYGMNYIRRLKSRSILAAGDAARMAKTDEKDYKDWRRIHESVARY